MSLDEETSEFTSRGTFDHPYPTTKIMWIPDTVWNVYFDIVNLFIFGFSLVIYFAIIARKENW